jgi:hypothetical protein
MPQKNWVTLRGQRSETDGANVRFQPGKPKMQWFIPSHPRGMGPARSNTRPRSSAGPGSSCSAVSSAMLQNDKTIVYYQLLDSRLGILLPWPGAPTWNINELGAAH